MQIGLLLLERATGRILEVNAAFLRMAGRASAEVVGRNFWEPPLVADADAGAEIHGYLLAGTAVTGVELPLQARDGRWLVLEVSGNASAFISPWWEHTSLPCWRRGRILRAASLPFCRSKPTTECARSWRIC